MGLEAAEEGRGGGQKLPPPCAVTRVVYVCCRAGKGSKNVLYLKELKMYLLYLKEYQDRLPKFCLTDILVNGYQFNGQKKQTD